MKKILNYSIVAALLVLSSWSCTKEIAVDDIDSQTWAVSIDAVKGDPDTKALSLSGNTLNATWTAGDVVSVTKNNTSVGTLTAKTSGSQTVLQGSLTGPFTTTDKLTLSFLSPDYTGQDGTIDYIAAHCDYAVAEVTITGTTGGTLVTSPAVFKNQQAITEFTFKEGNRIIHPSEVRVSTTGGKLVQKYNGTTATYGYLYVTMADPETSSFAIALKNDNAEKDEFRFVAKEGSDYYVGTKKVILTDGQYYKTTVSLTKFQMQYVYMGSAGYWATCNLGAFFEEEYGDYYAWGEVETKASYTWSNYKWANGSNTTLTKYCNDSSHGYEGFTDNKTVLDLEDDAAHVVLGGHWRIPTLVEERRLWNQITSGQYTWAAETVNGVYGYRVTYPANGNSIFLPAGGYFASKLSNVGSWGGFWSSSLYTSNPANCMFGHFKTDGLQFYSGTRSNGRTIRPVYDSSITVHVSGVSLDKTSLEFNSAGQTETLHATVLPNDAANKSVTWSSSDPSVATVSASGVVTAVSYGSAVITVTTEDGGFTATCDVNVNIIPTAISLSSTSLSVKRGSTVQLTATITPSAASTYPVTWSSSNSNYVSVDQNGNVTGKVKDRTATITATAGSLKATCSVTVTAPDLVSFSLSPSSLQMFPGDDVEVTIVPNPSDAVISSSSWYIDYEIPAIMGGGNNLTRHVLGVEPGNTQVRIVVWDGTRNFEKYLNVTVLDPCPNAVDLGLSVKWADRNFMAVSTTDSGRYYTWEEATRPNSTYDLIQSKTDGEWRMPTKSDMQNLLNNCTYAPETQNGVQGLRFTSRLNGNSIFLPNVGGYSRDTFYPASQMGCFYWSSTQDGSSAQAGYRLRWLVGSYTVTIEGVGNEDYKFAIRPVQ